MNLALAILLTVPASAIMIAAMLLVRRRPGGRFTDSDRASGVFGVVAIGFALLLGFVVFLPFTKYDDSRAGAEAEALAVLQQFETAQLMPSDVSGQLSGELVCYARSVVGLEWPAMRSNAETPPINPWGCGALRNVVNQVDDVRYAPCMSARSTQRPRSACRAATPT
jgi:hypothetical protein